MDYINISCDKVVLFVPETLKTTRAGHHLAPVELKAFQDIELCVVAHLKQHTQMRDPSKNSGTNQLLLSCVQPHDHQSQQQLFQDGVQPN